MTVAAQKLKRNNNWRLTKLCLIAWWDLFATDGGTAAAETRRGWHQLSCLTIHTHTHTHGYSGLSSLERSGGIFLQCQVARRPPTFIFFFLSSCVCGLLLFFLLFISPSSFFQYKVVPTNNRLILQSSRKGSRFTFDLFHNTRKPCVWIGESTERFLPWRR